MQEKAKPQGPHEFPVDNIRGDFPILNQTMNDHPLVYFDNAATTQKPQPVLDAISEYYLYYNANVHRSIHQLGEEATQAYEDAREKVKLFIRSNTAQEIVFVRGATEAINLVAHSFVAPRLEAEEEILVTMMEHHSNMVPWQLLSKHTGANVRVIPVNEDGELKIDEFEKLLNEKTKFLAITHISNALGTINPLKEIIAKAHDAGVMVLVDGAQGAPHLDINVQDLDCDFYVFSGHKMYGPTGIGVLYGKAELLDMMIPYQSGGEMISRVSLDIVEYKKPPYRFEAGTPNISGAIALGAAIDYLQDIGLDKIAAYEQSLKDYLMREARQVGGIGIVGSTDNKAAILSFNLEGIHAHDVGTVLNTLGIAIRAGHHCAMPLMDFFDVAATARASLAFYNTTDEIDKFIEALAKVKEVFG
jgi:cysteine desulfurase / selenocysteine lyase